MRAGGGRRTESASSAGIRPRAAWDGRESAWQAGSSQAQSQARGGHPRLDLRQTRLRGHGSGGGRVNAGQATQWATRSGRCAICNPPPFCSRMELVHVPCSEQKVHRGMHIASAALALFSQGRTRIVAPLPNAAAPSLPAPRVGLADWIALQASSDVWQEQREETWHESVARAGAGASSGEVGRETRSAVQRHEPCRASGPAGSAAI